MPARLGQDIIAGTHKVMQGAIECHVVGVPEGSAGGATWGGEDRLWRLIVPCPGNLDAGLPSWRTCIAMVLMPVLGLGGLLGSVVDSGMSRRGVVLPNFTLGALKMLLLFWPTT
jgi:hypothetical protein